MSDNELSKEIEDLTREKVIYRTVKAEPGAKWINYFLPQRPGINGRGDLLGGIALWSFIVMLICLLLGGTVIAPWEWLKITIPTLDIEKLTAFLTPIIAAAIKRSVESVKQ